MIPDHFRTAVTWLACFDHKELASHTCGGSLDGDSGMLVMVLVVMVVVAVIVVVVWLLLLI